MLLLREDRIDDHTMHSYPTLVDLLGLPPSPELGTFNNGVSLRAAFDNPHLNHSDTKPFAFSQYPRCGPGPLLEANGDCLQVAAANFSTMGFSVRDQNFRWTEWKAWNGEELKPIWGTHASRLTTLAPCVVPANSTTSSKPQAAMRLTLTLHARACRRDDCHRIIRSPRRRW